MNHSINLPDDAPVALLHAALAQIANATGSRIRATSDGHRVQYDLQQVYVQSRQQPVSAGEGIQRS